MKSKNMDQDDSDDVAAFLDLDDSEVDIDADLEAGGKLAKGAPTPPAGQRIPILVLVFSATPRSDRAAGLATDVASPSSAQANTLELGAARKTRLGRATRAMSLMMLRKLVKSINPHYRKPERVQVATPMCMPG